LMANGIKFYVCNSLTSGGSDDGSGVGCASGSNVFGTSSVWPKVIRGYRSQGFTEFKWSFN
jgi:hypothetical protein